MENGKFIVNKAIDNCLGQYTKSEEFTAFRRLAIEVKIHTTTTSRLQKDLNISLNAARTLVANLLIQYIYSFKNQIWKPRCAQMIEEERKKGIDKSKKHSQTGSDKTPANHQIQAQADVEHMASDSMMRHNTQEHVLDKQNRSIPVTHQEPGYITTHRTEADNSQDHMLRNDDFHREVFIPVPTPPPLSTRKNRLTRAVPMTTSAITNYIHTYTTEAWVAIKPLVNKTALIMEQLAQTALKSI